MPPDLELTGVTGAGRVGRVGRDEAGAGAGAEAGTREEAIGATGAGPGPDEAGTASGKSDATEEMTEGGDEDGVFSVFWFVAST